MAKINWKRGTWSGYFKGKLTRCYIKRIWSLWNCTCWFLTQIFTSNKSTLAGFRYTRDAIAASPNDLLKLHDKIQRYWNIFNNIKHQISHSNSVLVISYSKWFTKAWFIYVFSAFLEYLYYTKTIVFNIVEIEYILQYFKRLCRISMYNYTLDFGKSQEKNYLCAKQVL